MIDDAELQEELLEAEIELLKMRVDTLCKNIEDALCKNDELEMRVRALEWDQVIDEEGK